MASLLRAGIIGRTGRGNYGHGLDVAYRGLPEVEVVAVADPDPEGLEAAGERTGARRLYPPLERDMCAFELHTVSIPQGLDPVSRCGDSVPTPASPFALSSLPQRLDSPAA